MTILSVTQRDVFAARQRIRARLEPTPLVPAPALGERVGREVYLKLETTQPIGAFKIRGAANHLFAHGAEARRRGVVTASTGNHGRAVALAARWVGARAVVVVSRLVPEVKLEAIRRLGAEVRMGGAGQDDAEAEAARIASKEGLLLVHPYDDPFVIAGQGTMALELLEELPDVATVVTPLSGGGLASGLAVALKAADPAIRVVGVTMERGAAMHASLAAGEPVEVEEVPTLADSLGGGIGRENNHTFPICQALLDDAVLVGEEEIAAAMRDLFWQARVVAEGGAAVAWAAVAGGRLTHRSPGPLVVIVSGGNVDMSRFAEVVGMAAPPAH